MAKKKSPAATPASAASFPVDDWQQCGPAAIARYRLIHRMLSRKEEVTSAILCKATGMSRRQLRRDVANMRYYFGIPAKFDFSSNTYILTHPCPLFPEVTLDTQEGLTLTIFYHAFSAWCGPASADVLRGALRKISGAVGSQVRLFEPVPGGVHLPAAKLSPGELKFLPLVYQAIRGNQVLRILYANAMEHQPKTREIQPLFLSHARKLWNVYAYDRLSGEYRTFVLSRMRRAKPTGKKFDRPVKFDGAEIIKYNQGLYTGKEKHVVRLRLDKVAAFYIKESRWHELQTFRKLPDGFTESRLTVNNLFEIERDILYWGDHIEVLSPPALRKQIGEALERAAAKYR